MDETPLNPGLNLDIIFLANPNHFLDNLTEENISQICDIGKKNNVIIVIDEVAGGFGVFRAKELINAKKEIYSSHSLTLFLNNNYTLADFDTKPQLLNAFAELDDFDIYSSLKYWKNNPDFILSSLSDMILNRKLLKIKVQNTEFSTTEIEIERKKIQEHFNISEKEAKYFVFSNKVSNSTYNIEKANINILMKNGDVIDITSASDQFNIDALNKTINKYFLCYPKLK